ncbi:NUDIX domain-containing protein [Streptomyces cinerochromogenes]|uniref:NUDIX domain-containing protein n=1 Tax=Streptomyces cinerochromogenes TaxID=66422 RepID=A0ABW7BI79_9ACTN
MTSPNLRHAVRAVILNEEDRILLCRFVLSEPSGTIVVWAAPGGGVKPDETPLDALRRELREEVGLILDNEPPHVWHQEAVDPGIAKGYDGIVNDYFLVRTTSFMPRGSLTNEQLAAENIKGMRWWQPQEILEYHGVDLFSPRNLGTPLAALIAEGIPSRPIRLGL